MPITLNCACGKPLRVGDQFACKLVKCPVCSATQRAPAAPAGPAPAAVPPRTDTDADFEVLEETAPVPSSAPAKPRLKAAAVTDEPPPAPAPSGVVGKPKKKKKKKKADAAEGDDDWYERMRDGEAWMRRMIRGGSFVALGVAILIGVAIIYFQFWDEVKEQGGKVVFGVILFGLTGLAAVGKGVIGMVFGQFLGDEE